MIDNQKTILVGMPTQSGLVPWQTVQSLLQLHKPLPCAFIVVERQRVDKARNYMALQALKGGFEYLLMVDDDNPIPPETLELFIEDDKDIVAAPILSRNPNADGEHDLCAFYKRKVKLGKKEINLYQNIKKLKGKGPLHKVDATGTGCILIKTKVLATLFAKHQQYIFEFGDIKFDKKYTIDGKEYDRRTMSEDCEFSERAVNAGFEIWLDDRVKPYHLGRIEMLQWGCETK